MAWDWNRTTGAAGLGFLPPHAIGAANFEQYKLSLIREEIASPGGSMRGSVEVDNFKAPNRPLGARGPVTGREFDPTRAGGPIRQLSTGRIKVTDRGIDAVERHIGRFGHDEANQVMVDRLRRIARGEIEATRYDLNYYSHEPRESVRYRRQGFPTGAGDDYDLWNNAHAATLEDYGLRELDANGNRNLFHSDAWPFFPR